MHIDEYSKKKAGDHVETLQQQQQQQHRTTIKFAEFQICFRYF